MQRLLLRWLGRSSIFTKKGCQAINKTIWDCEWEPANTKRKQNSARSQEWEWVSPEDTVGAPGSAVSKGSLALDLSEATSYSPTHSHPVQTWARSSHLIGGRLRLIQVPPSTRSGSRFEQPLNHGKQIKNTWLHRHVLTITESHRECVTHRSHTERVQPSRPSNFSREGSLLKPATLNLSPIFIFLIRVHLRCHFKIH